MFAMLFVVATAAGQEIATFDSGMVGLDQTLRKLETTASVLHVVAHPDDEDGAMMTYCARGLGARAMLFSITRGEGGANMISDHFFDELGALRTLEHLRAAQYYGTELFYSRAVDYGYSKSLDEARRQWDDGMPILGDLVEVIRREQPTIMLSRFRGTEHDGHGHHQMAGVVSRLAFDAAADPDRFPDQLAKGLKPWQVKKLYVNNIRPQWRPEDKDAWNINIPTGNYDKIIGKTYAQVARFGLGFQRSQGITGHQSDAEPRPSYYRLLRVAGNAEELDDTTVKEPSLLTGLDTTLPGNFETPNESHLRQLSSIQSHINAARSAFNAGIEPDVLASLLAALKSVNTLLKEDLASHVLRNVLIRKAAALATAIRQASAIDLQCFVTTAIGKPPEFAVPGQKLTIHLRIANQGHNAVVIRRVSATPGNWAKSGPRIDEARIAPASVVQTSFEARVPLDARVTESAFHRTSIREPIYDVNSDFAHAAVPACPLRINAELEVNGQPILATADALVRIRHPEFGNVRYPLAITPPIGVGFLQTDGILPSDQNTYEVAVQLRSAANSASGTLSLQLPDGWTSTPEVHPFEFDRANEAATVRFRVVTDSRSPGRSYTIRAVAQLRGKEYTRGYRTVTARDVGRLNVFKEAIHHLRIVDVQVAKSSQKLPRVAHVSGSGDKVAESLGMLGITPTLLSASDLASRDLGEFDVVLVGVRAYAVRADLRTHNRRLLDFVAQGGTMIVQYQTPEFDNDFGPYPYTMGRSPEEVSEEDATVSILRPEHAVFNRPNRITTADFDHWVEQLGSKFLATWDDRYIPLLECHDANQDPQRGGMLVTRYGKGVYVYSAYAWYRQLPNGVPGAYRIFANMLSLPFTTESQTD